MELEESAFMLYEQPLLDSWSIYATARLNASIFLPFLLLFPPGEGGVLEFFPFLFKNCHALF